MPTIKSNHLFSNHPQKRSNILNEYDGILTRYIDKNPRLPGTIEQKTKVIRAISELIKNADEAKQILDTVNGLEIEALERSSNNLVDCSIAINTLKKDHRRHYFACFHGENTKAYTCIMALIEEIIRDDSLDHVVNYHGAEVRWRSTHNNFDISYSTSNGMTGPSPYKKGTIYEDDFTDPSFNLQFNRQVFKKQDSFNKKKKIIDSSVERDLESNNSPTKRNDKVTILPIAIFGYAEELPRALYKIGDQYFYQSTGSNSGAAHTIFPFEGFLPPEIVVGFLKKPDIANQCASSNESINKFEKKETLSKIFTPTILEKWLKCCHVDSCNESYSFELLGRMKDKRSLIISCILGEGIWEKPEYDLLVLYLQNLPEYNECLKEVRVINLPNNKENIPVYSTNEDVFSAFEAKFTNCTNSTKKITLEDYKRLAHAQDEISVNDNDDYFADFDYNALDGSPAFLPVDG